MGHFNKKGPFKPKLNPFHSVSYVLFDWHVQAQLNIAPQKKPEDWD